MQIAAAVTMVREDLFFLKAWLRHYGEALGRENCYIINHGRGTAVAEAAAGCNVIGIPGDPHKNFDVKRWGLLNGIVGGLRRYYRHVIVGDVDELVVLDPEGGVSLEERLAEVKEQQVLTPLGLEVIHRIDLEHEEITDRILGPRMHVRPAPHYSKPCIISAPGQDRAGRAFHAIRQDQCAGRHVPAAPEVLRFCGLFGGDGPAQQGDGCAWRRCQEGRYRAALVFRGAWGGQGRLRGLC